MNGVINILKPPGMTSNDVVVYIRKILKIKKVGHTGTLDPGAAGVLPICIGSATKISNYITSESKTYICELKLGNRTSTYDRYGSFLYDTDNDISFSYTMLKSIIDSFIGEINQTPPIYSAIKINGQKLYEYARKGIEIEIPQRKITIYSINIIYYNPPLCLMEVVCSKGTYIRSLCNDIGDKLGCGGYMNFLLRTRTGLFDIKNSHTLQEVLEKPIEELVLKIDDVLNYNKIFLPEKNTKSILNGNPVELDTNYIKDYSTYTNPVLIYLYPNIFIGLGNIEDNILYTQRLLL